MNKYDVLFIIDVDTAEDKKEALINKFSKLIEDKNGKVESVDKWGNKKLAYPINYKNEGYYVLMNFASEASVVPELDALMSITESVVRHMISRKDA